MADRFELLIQRLVEKMKLSQVPPPGFIIGLSGTDSTLAFLLLYEACKQMGIPHRVYGIHYTRISRSKPTWFELGIMPWLLERCPEAHLAVKSPLGVYADAFIWADLHVRSLNKIELTGHLSPLDLGQNYWVAGTINATEFALGTYSNMAASASIQPLQRVWKSHVMEMCAKLGVPDIAMENARIPDCACGRDELAAAHIEKIDDILRHSARVTRDTLDLMNQLMEYVALRKRENGFKERIPYLL